MTPTKHDELQARINDQSTITMMSAQLTDSQEQECRKKTLSFLKQVGASFVSEMSWETGITEYVLKPILYKMERESLVEKIRVDFWKVDPRLAARVPDQSARGQGGFDNFSKKRWFGITKDGLSALEAML